MSDTRQLLARRARLLGAKAPLFYAEPLHIVRGDGVWLYDADGRAYLDCYNNVPVVGHCHPQVVEAIHRQAATLNVHTRYLHELILDYTERLLGKFDASLSMAMYACTGSEANDQALRMARLLTGHQGIICTNLTYHGNTTAVDEVSPLFYGKVSANPRVHAIPYTDSYRPPGGLQGAALTEHYLAEIDRALASFETRGIGCAGMILCSIFANEGLPDVPPGFMARAVEKVRRAGGLFIADEVQAGFGRTGRMWGYELADVVPDIVTLGKPMGNGFPIAAVVARAELVNGFRERTMYFNTFGGNPVACAAASAVLDVIEGEQLVDHARDMGDYLRAGLTRLEARHEVIGDVRGAGLWVGVELVRDRATKQPATAEAQRVVEHMKNSQVLLGRIGEFDNVLKIRPPLVFSRDNADLLLATLDEALGRL
jgi:4-aminobutyrate aminotransferase-like enzyme